mgnify:CR=1 FL=1
MIDSIVAALNKVYADWQGKLGAVGGAIIGLALALGALFRERDAQARSQALVSSCPDSVSP